MHNSGTSLLIVILTTFIISVIGWRKVLGMLMASAIALAIVGVFYVLSI